MIPRPPFLIALAAAALGAASCQEPSVTAERERVGAATSPASEAPAPLLRLAWGSAPGQIGHKLEAESAPEGPMSLTTDGAGRLYVLDQVNRRVQVFDSDGAGAAPRIIPIGSDTVQDLAVLEDGPLVLLDRLRERSLTFVSPAGEVISKVPIEGHGIAEGGGVSGLVVHRGSVWVEAEGEVLVEVASVHGRPLPDRVAWDGRPSRRDGSLFRLALAKEDGESAWLRRLAPSGKVLGSRAIRFEMPIRHLVAADSDRRGRLYLGAHLERRDGGDRVVEERESLVVLSPAGKRLTAVDFPPTSGPEEQFRTIDVSPAGVVHHLRCTEAGVEIRRWQP